MTVVVVSVSLYWAYLFTCAFRLKQNRKSWTSLWSVMARRPELKYLVRVRFLLLYTLLDELLLHELLDEILVRFPCYFGL